MPGFVAVFGDSLQIYDSILPDHLIVDRIKCSGCVFERRTLNKFLNDKLFYEDQNHVVILDGVVFNRLELCRKYSLDGTWASCIIALYNSKGGRFLNELRGSFSGVIYNKTDNTTFVFTDQIGSKHVYYSYTDKGIVVASEIGYIVDVFKQNNIQTHLNETCVYMAISYGFMLDDKTLFSNIQRLIAGHSLVIQGKRITEQQYHVFDNVNSIQATEEELIEKIDLLFRQAVKREFDKDIEYGYKHIATLSGGFDSRMTCWVAHEMGYERQLNFNFSQTGCLDNTIAQKIAVDLKHEYIYKMLDNGTCLFDIDDTAKLDWGGMLYFCLSHGKISYDDIDFGKYGVLHTGVLGDAILSTIASTPYHTSDYSIFTGYYSSAMLNRLSQYSPKYKYPNEDMFLLYNRGLGGACHGLLPMQEKTETFSPFYDVDFFEFCMQIPMELRFNHKIYLDWIAKKYPEAGKYAWTGSGKNVYEMIEEREKKGKQVNNSSPIKYSQFLGKTIVSPFDPMFTSWVGRKIRKHLHFRKEQGTIEDDTYTLVLNSPNTMNPIDYWYNNNRELQDYMDIYWKTNYGLTEQYLPNCVVDDLKHLFYDLPGVLHKIMALTILSVVKASCQKNILQP